MSAREQIRDFVDKELVRRNGGKPVEFSDHESLLLSDRTDSLFFIDLIVFISSKLQIKLNQAELQKEDLDTIDKMVALIESAKK